MMRRSRMELNLEVLQAIVKGREKKSKISYAANLSFDRVVRCLSFLEEHGLIEKELHESSCRYRPTSEGMEIVKNYVKILSVMNGSSPIIIRR